MPLLWAARARPRQGVGGKLAIDDSGIIHLTYYYLNYYGYSRVYYARSADGGNTWTSTGGQSGCFPWAVTPALGPNQHVYMVWERWKCNRSNLPNRVMVRRSADGGTNWDPYVEILPGRVVLNAGREADALVVDHQGTLHLIIRPEDSPSCCWGYPLATMYYRSTDGGGTWQLAATIPNGFVMGGIYEYQGALFIAGHDDQDREAFIRSTDYGDSWEGPFLVPGLANDSYGNYRFTQIVTAPSGAYYAWMWQSAVISQDNGLTWSEPELITNGAVTKLLAAHNGDLLAIGSYQSPEGTQVGLFRYQQPYGVEAPEFLSLWEKETFTFAFDALGTGMVHVSFPADAAEVDPDVIVSVAGQPVQGLVVEEDDRVLVSFPISTEAWTSCSVPLNTRKGTVSKWSAIGKQIKDLEEQLIAAVEAKNPELARDLDERVMALKAELASSEHIFDVTLSAETGGEASDQTSVSIFGKLTTVYAHFKANPPEKAGSKLLLLSDESISVDISQPFNLEVKVTHLTAGQAASVSLDGQFATIDVVESSATGTHKTTHYLFYPPTTSAQSDIITVNVTVDGVTNAIPLVVSLN